MARLRLLPQDVRFFELFEQAAALGVTGAETLLQMCTQIDQAENYRAQIAEIEHRGDAVIHEVVDKLNRTFVTPLDPEDIRAIANQLDNIIDFTQAAAERIVLYDVQQVYPASQALVSELLAATREVQCVIGLLRDFAQAKEILRHCIEINRLENAGDKIYREALGRLFREGNLLELIRWKEICEQIEQAIDECEDLAEVIESVVVKHA